MSLLAFESFSYRHPAGTRPALDGIELALAGGEFAVVAGRSGSGKSTLLQAACGLVPHFHGGVASGSVRVCGLDSRDHGPGALAAVTGFLGQEPETQVVMGTVAAELAFPLENRGWSPAAIARGVEEAALALGIGGLLERPTSELSGGELQKVALGAAIAARPRLLLLDEPTSQLDPVAGDELLGVLRRINEEWGTTVLLAEHRLERCLPAADRVVVLDGGRVVCDAAPAGFLDWAAGAEEDLLPPPARLFWLAGLAPLPRAVKAARQRLRELRPASAGPEPDAGGPAPAARDGGRRGRARRRVRDERPGAALRLDGIWLEPRDRAPVLSAISLLVAPGERVALMGRNGAGKSTLLRVACGLAEPTRGSVRRAGRAALLLQYPGDYFVSDRVGDELSAAELEAAGLGALAARHPRDLSGGERQKLALAMVCSGEPPALLCLDEPTRGMGRRDKEMLAREVERRADAGAAVVIATHDAEFAARWATRVVLLGPGRVVADAPPQEVLAGGWYFSTQTARILDGAALLPEAGAALLSSSAPEPAGVLT